MSLFDFDAPPDRYAVMGNPVAHSKSPAIHGEFARQTGQRMEYQAILVDEGGLAQAIGNFQASGGKGLNITVPFKHDARQLMDECSEYAQHAGAVNTILFRQDGRRYGDNTDGVGLVRDIVNNHGGTIQDSRVLILGAGGAVHGVLEPILNEHPREVVIANRTIDKAIILAQSITSTIPVEACGYAALGDSAFNLIINGTSASMKNELPPLPASVLATDSWCYDMMYGDEPTIFMNWAREHGAEKYLDGLGMLVEQAAESFYLWRNVRPDTTPVIKLLRNKIQ
jgi:shikimate dehydrogenase